MRSGEKPKDKSQKISQAHNPTYHKTYRIMAVAIRLRRAGAKNHPYYSIVVADQRSPRDGKFIEIIGKYDPKQEGENFTVKLDRAEHWLSCGARASQTVGSIINKARKKLAA